METAKLLSNSAYKDALYGWEPVSENIRLGQKIRITFDGLKPKTGYAYSAPTKEYLLAKANMCRNLALTQINAGEGEKAAENLMRMVKALGEVGIIIEREGK
jgi:hypothetical protein